MSAIPFFSPSDTTKGNPNSPPTIEQIKTTLDETDQYCRVAKERLPQIEKELTQIDHELREIEDDLTKISYVSKPEEIAYDDFEELLRSGHDREFLDLLQGMLKKKLGDNESLYESFKSNTRLTSIRVEKNSYTWEEKYHVEISSCNVSGQRLSLEIIPQSYNKQTRFYDSNELYAKTFTPFFIRGTTIYGMIMDPIEGFCWITEKDSNGKIFGHIEYVDITCQNALQDQQKKLSERQAILSSQHKELSSLHQQYETLSSNYFQELSKLNAQFQSLNLQPKATNKSPSIATLS